MISKLNKILLEKYPMLYHSKTVQLLAAGIGVWLTSFVLGYVLLGRSYAIYEDITDFYFKSFFVTFHILLVILTLSIWAVHFYKQNPIRGLYPLQKFYYTKLLLLIMIPFWLIGTAKTSFDLGVHTKFKHLILKEEQVKNVLELKLDYSDLISEIELFTLDNVERSKIKLLVKNYNNVYQLNSWYDTAILYTMACVALFFAALSIWFEFMEIRYIQLSIPVGGVLGLIFGVSRVLIDMFVDSRLEQKIQLGFSFVFCLSIMVLTMYFVLKKRKSRFIATLGMNVTYILSSFIFLLLLVMLYKVFNISGLKYIVKDYGLILSFIGLSLFYKLIKPWKAKKKLN